MTTTPQFTNPTVGHRRHLLLLLLRGASTHNPTISCVSAFGYEHLLERRVENQKRFSTLTTTHIHTYLTWSDDSTITVKIVLGGSPLCPHQNMPTPFLLGMRSFISCKRWHLEMNIVGYLSRLQPSDNHGYQQSSQSVPESVNKYDWASYTTHFCRLLVNKETNSTKHTKKKKF